MTADNDTQDHSTPGRWRAAIDSFVTGLGVHLGEPVSVVKSNEFEEGFSCLVRGPAPSRPLQVAWEGVLGMAYDSGRPDISASLFLYSRGRRLRLDDQSGSYLEIVYEGPLDGSGTWRDLGWFEDDFGEFEAYDEYGD
ncbi:hypothetical protein F5X71_19565 [Nocardia brasiliensis]|uniref:Uncharacterized protein n=1 Tax=Nocardia brasiliensis TaxID=37326 RepID=A0A6G9XTL0_NOCBR|nr:hypothetical protein [Nocardia brasiliensis]QIS04237.1 hypothetical protein F5X71_19565 [Nocardia brasiliensis]